MCLVESRCVLCEMNESAAELEQYLETPGCSAHASNGAHLLSVEQ